ncbi:hypothetical protein AQI95_39130 [Streptomyces yokosukanensis]|uniref:Uncharacterized protein n=1 Tax=Streptomyces yokosukanensis TaxID=67386 RepID=A0A101NUH1_9ACTN|nr:hypothetical protein AQI95_39130 [Streptomyces yokosukanensis]
MGELVKAGSGVLVCGEQDEELLGVGGEVQGLAQQMEFGPGRVLEAEWAAAGDTVVAQTAGELGACHGGEFGAEPLGVLGRGTCSSATSSQSGKRVRDRGSVKT